MGGSWSTQEYNSTCQCTHSVQVKNLSVELICPPRQVWLPDGAKVLVTAELGQRLTKKNPIGMYLQPIETS